jgi:hypothetical protein
VTVRVRRSGNYWTQCPSCAETGLGTTSQSRSRTLAITNAGRDARGR